MTSFDQVVVMGLGRFGGGLGVTRWLLGQGATVIISDRSDEAALAAPLAELAGDIAAGRVQLRLGEHDPDDLRGASLLVVNPAVPRPWSNGFIAAARAAGVPITTEIRLLTERIGREQVIGITGSAGKSTTCAMIHHALTSLGVNAFLGGNIGGSLLGVVDSIGADATVVLELSSAMLWWLDSAPGYSPRTAVITNITPNHLDWHETFEHYTASKETITRHQRAGDVAIDGRIDTTCAAADTVPLPGKHNRRNAALAARAVHAATGFAESRVLATLADFRGLPHRLELVAEYDGFRFYNDSKATTPEATVLAVEAFDDPRRVHLIAGGYDKAIDLGAINAKADELGGLYTIGTTGPALSHGTNATACGELSVAIERARQQMAPGDVLLLSPGCASWDQFPNYESRGELFRRLVT